MPTAHSSSARNIDRSFRLASLAFVLFLLTLISGAFAAIAEPEEVASRSGMLVTPDEGGGVQFWLQFDQRSWFWIASLGPRWGDLGLQRGEPVVILDTFAPFFTRGEIRTLSVSHAGAQAVSPDKPIQSASPDIHRRGGLLAAPALGTPGQDLIRIISLVIGSFVVAIGTMVLARRYWMR